ncbi:MAG: hypothetical protein HYT87_15650 [Nitrospirae bacterium]|nr:hypothetical protein [Nitrospirota bacterium]
MAMQRSNRPSDHRPRSGAEGARNGLLVETFKIILSSLVLMGFGAAMTHILSR